MACIPSPEILTVLILKADHLCADALRRHTLAAFPQARVITTFSVVAAQRVLVTGPVSLLLAGTEALPDGDTLDFVSDYLRGSATARRVLIVAAHCENLALASMRALPIKGVFDSTNDQPENFVAALRMVADGGRYWSPSIIERLRRHHFSPNSLFRLLTAAEQLVLSIIGDGCDDDTAAQELGLKPATISSVRRDLHRKLGVQHRGELVRIAAQNGFVRFTPDGVERPGFATLAATCQARSGKRGRLAIA